MGEQNFKAEYFTTIQQLIVLGEEPARYQILAAVNREFEKKLEIQAESAREMEKNLNSSRDMVLEILRRQTAKSFVVDDMSPQEVSD